MSSMKAASSDDSSFQTTHSGIVVQWANAPRECGVEGGSGTLVWENVVDGKAVEEAVQICIDAMSVIFIGCAKHKRSGQIDSFFYVKGVKREAFFPMGMQERFHVDDYLWKTKSQSEDRV